VRDDDVREGWDDACAESPDDPHSGRLDKRPVNRLASRVCRAAPLRAAPSTACQETAADRGDTGGMPIYGRVREDRLS